MKYERDMFSYYAGYFGLAVVIGTVVAAVCVITGVL
jgi:hypothetical protein